MTVVVLVRYGRRCRQGDVALIEVLVGLSRGCVGRGRGGRSCRVCVRRDAGLNLFEIVDPDPTNQLVLDAGAVGHGDVVCTDCGDAISVALNVGDVAIRNSARLLSIRRVALH